jgi:hypothetical protein
MSVVLFWKEAAASQEVTGDSIASTTSVTAPSASYAVVAAVLASSLSLFAPTVAPGAVTVVGAHVASGEVLSAPTVQLATGPQDVDGAFIASGSVVNAPNASYRVTVPCIFSGAKGVSLAGLVSHWALDEASGTRNDSHGTNHLTDTNTVGTAAGQIENAAHFIAANSEDLSVADNASLAFTTALSASFWLRQTDLLDDRAFLGKWTFATDGEWVIQSPSFVAAGGPGGITIFLATAAGDSGGGCRMDFNDVDMVAGSRYHVVVVYDGSLTGNANRLKVWVNGVQKTLTIGSGAVPATLRNGGATLYLGRFGGSLFRYLNGDMDEVRLWNSALTPSDVATLYERFGGAALFTPSVAHVVSGAHVASTAVLAAPSASYVVAAATKTTSATLFAPSATVGPVTVAGVHLAPTTTLFAPVVTQGAQFVDGAHVASVAALNAPTIAPGAVTVTAAHLLATSTLNVPAVTAGAVTVAGPHVASLVQLHSPALSQGAYNPAARPGDASYGTDLAESLAVTVLTFSEIESELAASMTTTLLTSSRTESEISEA